MLTQEEANRLDLEFQARVLGCGPVFDLSDSALAVVVDSRARDPIAHQRAMAKIFTLIHALADVERFALAGLEDEPEPELKLVTLN